MNPKVDFAFKYVFGNPDYPEITISLINSVLSLPPDKQIVQVEITNPSLDRRTVDDKYSIFLILNYFTVTTTFIMFFVIRMKIMKY